MTRRDLLRLLLASPLAATFDVERALWVPKAIITVPAMPAYFTKDQFSIRMIEVTRIGDPYRSYIPAFLKPTGPLVIGGTWAPSRKEDR